MEFHLTSVVLFGLICFAIADLNNVVEICCDEGTQWAKSDTRCDNFPTAVFGVENKDQGMCRTVLEVCCLKSKQQQMCTQGKSDAMDTGYTSCAIREDVLGAVTYRECCHCCNMGLQARRMRMDCNIPSIGNPCDQKFIECCTGITDENPDKPSNLNQTDVADIDECTVFGEQLCSQMCVNTVGSFRCECRQGYTLAQDERTCVRQTETCAGSNECSQECIDTRNGPQCRCREGFRLLNDRKTCQDIDECRRGMSNCRDDEMCVNTEGGFQCRPREEQRPNCPQGYLYDENRRACIPDREVTDQCPQGYAFNTLTERCEDIDECARRIDTCTSSQRCENTEGSYVCRRLTGCGTGYTLNEETQECVDQDECEAGTHNCGRGYECVNIEGSFRCNPRGCPEGYTVNQRTGRCERLECPVGLRPGGSSVCVDVDECSEQPEICQSYQTCENSYGSYRCIDPIDCRPGYEVDPNGQQCVDIDECARGTHECTGGASCINRQGSYSCTCAEGYRRVNGVCQDKDECQYGNVCPFNSHCENTEGSFTCVCNPGLEKRDRQCIDIDECRDANRCQHRCVNIVGSYHCTCETGYQLAADERTCEDIDECRQFGGRGSICIGNCINLPGSYRCTCPDGWRLLGNGRSCQDINECEEGLDRCGQDPDIMCFNTRGSHKCPRITCPQGFTRSQLGPRGNSVRCRRISFTCRQGDDECLNAPLSLSYNFLSFPTNVKVPTDLFSMSGPQTSEKFFEWRLNVTSVYPAYSSVTPVNRNYFDLRIGRNDAVVSLQKDIKGPQDIELQLTMTITDRYTGYTGTALSRIYLYVTSQNLRGTYN